MSIVIFADTSLVLAYNSTILGSKVDVLSPLTQVSDSFVDRAQSLNG